MPLLKSPLGPRTARGAAAGGGGLVSGGGLVPLEEGDDGQSGGGPSSTAIVPRHLGSSPGGAIGLDNRSLRQRHVSSKHDYVKVRIRLDGGGGAAAGGGNTVADKNGYGGGAGGGSPLKAQVSAAAAAGGGGGGGGAPSSSPPPPPPSPPLRKKHAVPVVMSRYLVARNLAATLVPYHEAVKIALETKKQLVDREMLDITYAQFEQVLMECAVRRGHGSNLMKTWHRCLALFHAKRVPLVVLVCGTAATGKSQLSRAIAQRLNVTNVVPVDMLAKLAPRDGDAAFRWDAAGDDAYADECERARRCVAHEVVRCVTGGKPLVLEGVFVHPDLYTRQQLVEVAADASKRGRTVDDHQVKSTVMEGARDAGSAGETSAEERTRWTAHWNQHAPLVVTLCLSASASDVSTRLPLWKRQHAPTDTDVSCATTSLLAVQDSLIDATRRLPTTPGAAHAIITSRNGYVDDSEVDRAHRKILDVIAAEKCEVEH